MSGAGDVDLLRRYEPVVRYTHGEFFFPMTADDYVAECDLWAVDAAGQRSLLVPAGQLTIDDLATWTSRVPDRSLFLQFVQEPLSGVAVAPGRDRAGRPRFSAPSRLARVGIVARLIDAGFDLSLLVRGTVPGGTVAAAELKYAAIRARNPDFSYYGRVVRHAGWTVCQYLFFYAMNDWRSSFAGANDHEADWEQCFVFLEEHDDGSSTPVWFARAAHDEVGADLRRRWDDPLLQREGDHPIVFAGAGSHAAYVEPGEYLQAVPLRLPRRIQATATALRQFWTTTLGQGQGGAPGQASADRRGPVRRLRARRRRVRRARAAERLDADPDRRRHPVGDRIRRPVRSRHGGPARRRACPRGPEVDTRRPPTPVVDRPDRLRRPRCDAAAGAGSRGADERDRAISGPSLDADRVAIAELERTSQRLGVRVAAAQRAGRSEAFVARCGRRAGPVVRELRGLRVRVDGTLATIEDSEAELARVHAGDPAILAPTCATSSTRRTRPRSAAAACSTSGPRSASPSPSCCSARC